MSDFDNAFFAATHQGAGSGTGDGFSVNPETVEQGMNIANTMLDFFNSRRDPITGCTKRQVRKGKCGTQGGRESRTQNNPEYQKMVQAQAEADRLMRVKAEQDKKKRNGIIIGVSVGALVITGLLIWYFKFKK